MHKKKLQSVLDRRLRLASKVPRRFPSRRKLGDRSLDDTVRCLARTFYVRAARYSDNLLIAGLGPVSYTHLDVYKRQLYTEAV